MKINQQIFCFTFSPEYLGRQPAEPDPSWGQACQSQVRRVTCLHRHRHRCQLFEAQVALVGAADGARDVVLRAAHHRTREGRARARVLHTRLPGNFGSLLPRLQLPCLSLPSPSFP